MMALIAHVIFDKHLHKVFFDYGSHPSSFRFVVVSVAMLGGCVLEGRPIRAIRLDSSAGF